MDPYMDCGMLYGKKIVIMPAMFMDPTRLSNEKKWHKHAPGYVKRILKKYPHRMAYVKNDENQVFSTPQHFAMSQTVYDKIKTLINKENMGNANSAFRY